MEERSVIDYLLILVIIILVSTEGALFWYIWTGVREVIGKLFVVYLRFKSPHRCPRCRAAILRSDIRCRSCQTSIRWV